MCVSILAPITVLHGQTTFHAVTFSIVWHCLCNVATASFRICGLFGGKFNLANFYWLAKFKLHHINLFHLRSTWHGKVLHMATKPQQRPKCLLCNRNLAIVVV